MLLLTDVLSFEWFVFQLVKFDLYFLGSLKVSAGWNRYTCFFVNYTRGICTIRLFLFCPVQCRYQIPSFCPYVTPASVGNQPPHRRSLSAIVR